MDLLAKEKLLVLIYTFLLGGNYTTCRILLGFGLLVFVMFRNYSSLVHSGFHPSHGQINIVGANRVNVADQVKTIKLLEQCADIANRSATRA